MVTDRAVSNLEQAASKATLRALMRLWLEFYPNEVDLQPRISHPAADKRSLFRICWSSVAGIAVNSSLAGTTVDCPKGMSELLSASERAIECLKGLDLTRLSLRRLSSYLECFPVTRGRFAARRVTLRHGQPTVHGGRILASIVQAT